MIRQSIARGREAVIHLPEPWRNALVLALLSLVWGSSFILMKWALEVFDHVQVASIRMAWSGVAFLPLLAARWRRVDWSKWPYLILVGFCGSAIPAFLFALAQTRISSSAAGILNSLTPLFTLVLGIVFFHSPFVWRRLAGVVLGLSGAVVLLLFAQQGPMETQALYGLLVVLATICYATSINTIGAYLKEMPSLLISTASFAIVGCPIFLFLLVGTPFLETMRTHPGAWEAFGYLTILALLGTVLASVLFFQLVKWSSPLFSSTVTYLIPVVAIFWGMVYGEPVGWLHLLGLVLILGGIYLSRRRKGVGTTS